MALFHSWHNQRDSHRTRQRTGHHRSRKRTSDAHLARNRERMPMWRPRRPQYLALSTIPSRSRGSSCARQGYFHGLENNALPITINHGIEIKNSSLSVENSRIKNATTIIAVANTARTTSNMREILKFEMRFNAITAPRLLRGSKVVQHSYQSLSQ